MQISPTLDFLFLFVRVKSYFSNNIQNVGVKDPGPKRTCMFLRYKNKGFHKRTANLRLVIIGALTDKKNETFFDDGKKRESWMKRWTDTWWITLSIIPYHHIVLLLLSD